jgi:hypothetical protein
MIVYPVLVSRVHLDVRYMLEMIAGAGVREPFDRNEQLETSRIFEFPFSPALTHFNTTIGY